MLNKMTKIKNKTILNLILLFCFFALFTAYFIEYFLGHQPCNLCLIERIPYILTIIIIILSIIFKKFEKVYLIILSLIFISATLISFYHFGIEQGFIKESLVCDLNSQNNSLTKEALLTELKEKTISCKDVTFKIIGLSLATINIFISLILSIITIKLFLNYEKN
ncbi:MAG: disulfide bond formation protein DsbB [Pelagibacterales bacterium]|nr:disulfide bond formation protein DsbB [Pelagibacterales bacterium]